jgi:hypothetical protein
VLLSFFWPVANRLCREKQIENGVRRALENANLWHRVRQGKVEYFNSIHDRFDAAGSLMRHGLQRSTAVHGGVHIPQRTSRSLDDILRLVGGPSLFDVGAVCNVVYWMLEARDDLQV